MAAVALTFILLFALLVVGAVVLIVRLVRGAPRHAVAEPSCGSCGYAVQGLPTFTCPECGSDLREVGIRTSQEARPLSSFWRKVIWTLALVLPAVVTTLLLMVLLPVILPAPYLISDSRTFEPRSKEYEGITASVIGRSGDQVLLTSGTLTFTLETGDYPSTVLTIDLCSRAYRCNTQDGGSVASDDPVDLSAILRWMETVGINTSSEAVKIEAKELLQIPDVLMNNTRLYNYNTSHLRAVGASRSVQGLPSRVSAVLLLGSLLLWFVIWWLGLRRISRGRTRGASTV
ncbi:MAG: hypothetical protein JXQ73_14320 [Phycisphaerae bacterium]|nr:hypothetical protein [Phycisphaerae bacterium]